MYNTISPYFFILGTQQSFRVCLGGKKDNYVIKYSKDFLRVISGSITSEFCGIFFHSFMDS